MLFVSYGARTCSNILTVLQRSGCYHGKCDHHQQCTIHTDTWTTQCTVFVLQTLLCIQVIYSYTLYCKLWGFAYNAYALSSILGFSMQHYCILFWFQTSEQSCPLRDLRVKKQNTKNNNKKNRTETLSFLSICSWACEQDQTRSSHCLFAKLWQHCEAGWGGGGCLLKQLRLLMSPELSTSVTKHMDNKSEVGKWQKNSLHWETAENRAET